MKPKAAFMCGDCEEIHSDEDSARECCQPEVYDGWSCSECGEWHDLKSDAAECSSVDSGCCPKCFREPVFDLDAEQILIHGSCSVCTPAVPYDIKFQMENLREQALREGQL